MTTRLDIVPGSLSAVAGKANMTLAESFLNVDALILVDTSASMDSNDAAGGKKRYTVAVEELKRLQTSLPGKIGVVSFSDHAVFCPGGVPQFLCNGTNLAGALRYIKAADDLGIKFIVISDGAPDEPEEAIAVAKKFKTKIDVVYVGPEKGSGSKFLAELAAATGGQSVTADLAKDLNQKVQLLLA